MKNHNDAAISAAQLASHLINIGLTGVYSPIVHGHYTSEWITHDSKNSSWWYQLQQPFLNLSRAGIVGMIPGWKQSKGVYYEMIFFQSHKTPIFYLNPTTLELSKTET